MTPDPRSDGRRADDLPEALPESLRRVRDALVAPPAPEVAQRHLAAIVEAAEEAVHTVPDPVPGTARMAGAAAPWATRARRVLGLTSVKLALTASAALAASGGMAVTGTLPEPAQRVVSEVADRIGVDLPSPDDAADRDAPGAPDTGTPGTDAPGTTEPPATTPPTPPPADGADDPDDDAPTQAPTAPPASDTPVDDTPASDTPASDPPDGADDAPPDPADDHAPDEVPPTDADDPDDAGRATSGADAGDAPSDDPDPDRSDTSVPVTNPAP
ncbi:MAG TPA: hypothetical protein VGA69_08115 [Nitriliruptorales bacterium]